MFMRFSSWILIYFFTKLVDIYRNRKIHRNVSLTHSSVPLTHLSPFEVCPGFRACWSGLQYGWTYHLYFLCLIWKAPQSVSDKITFFFHIPLFFRLFYLFFLLIFSSLSPLFLPFLPYLLKSFTGLGWEGEIRNLIQPWLTMNKNDSFKFHAQPSLWLVTQYLSALYLLWILFIIAPKKGN